MDFERRVVGQGIGQDVASGHLNRFLEEIVFQDDKAVVQGGSRGQDSLPVLENLLHRSDTIVNVEVCVVKQGEDKRNEEADGNSPSVSKVEVMLVRVQITGVSPIAREIARTRLLEFIKSGLKSKWRVIRLSSNLILDSVVKLIQDFLCLIQ